ncbi:PF08747 domain protein [Leptospira yanagawae serovar Saopaulo str. Sao Paulo = ATCC 700523]|uniref:PF08747 domain protein n=1 Tax=Leptospira yanagawae serovar Saopaulo str. Sao Paulo = ATCC 700523 TaxID=1249483 RepID=A0A5E8HJ30_9LEPT|nr:BREX protein BrxB domain-containing protein [Leptospira yanagawae]EOQ90723.1 PF08747 domain protein [Leptospira yanagawae serovar Saopaulo str. Sao Paulo = ATCC 700523]
MNTELLKRLNDLKKDITHPEGIQVTQSQNYPFSIFVYPPSEEFFIRSRFLEMIQEIKKDGIEILEINLAHECLALIGQRDGDTSIDDIIKTEKALFEYAKDYSSSFVFISDVFSNLLESEEGISKSISKKIEDFHKSLRGKKGVVFITRAGFLYPFYRTSSLLTFLTNTRGLPVIFLYPGVRTSETSLSYMGVLSPDSNYRPRMY